MTSPLSRRQQEIVDTARRLLSGEGADGLTLGRVARELGIKTPSLYKHFESKRHLDAVLIGDGLTAAAEALEAAGPDLDAIAGAYRRFALDNPQLYRLINDRPLPRDLLPDGVEARAAAPLLAAVGDPDLARSVWAFAHGMVSLELADRFPPGADLDAAWAAAIAAFARGTGRR